MLAFVPSHPTATRLFKITRFTKDTTLSVMFSADPDAGVVCPIYWDPGSSINEIMLFQNLSPIPTRSILVVNLV